MLEINKLTTKNCIQFFLFLQENILNRVDYFKQRQLIRLISAFKNKKCVPNYAGQLHTQLNNFKEQLQKVRDNYKPLYHLISN